MRFIYGTGNQGKINQVKDFFNTQNRQLEILSLKDIGFTGEIIEDGKTFEENSMIKAKAIEKFCIEHDIHEVIITDDTGLCVDALDGRPGVYSARYAGDHAPQEAAIAKLLNEMKEVSDEKRTAQFICVLTAVLPSGKYLEAKGVTKGKIATKPGILGKLTYGPIFIPNGFSCVMNEIPDEELGKTHREKAFLEMIQKIEQEA